MSDLAVRKRNTVLFTVVLLAGMGTLVYYAVPLYRLFCQVTGYGGTTQRADVAPGAPGAPGSAGTAGGRVITVRFVADVNPQLPWSFYPAQREVRVRVGERTLIHYVARNNGRKTVVGTATFNVSPSKSGMYFNKIACFCFEEQSLKPGQQVDMPVSFFIDPKLLADRNLNDVNTITLSYTFFRAFDAKRSAVETSK
jgi:cytochrome c oxidase assembly protein subunit 11